jgi:MFS family permease
MSYFERRLKLSKNVIAMGFVSFFNDTASEMIYPLIPTFLTVWLGAPVYIMGFIVGLSESLSNICKVFSGWYSDKLDKRKPFVVFGYSLSAISKAMIGLAYSWPMAMAARIADRFGKGIRVSARDALIADYTQPKYRGRAFGLHRGFDSAGAAIGPIIAIILLSVLNNNLRAIFLLSLIPSIIGILLLIFFTEEKKSQDGEFSLNVPHEKLEFRSISPEFNKFLLVTVLFNIGNSSDLFLILRSQNLALSLTVTTGAYILYHLTHSVLSMPIGILADKIGTEKILLSGFVTFSIAFALSGFITDGIWMWLVFALYGLYMAQTDSIIRVYIAGIVPHRLFGTAFGLHQTVVGICTFFASLIAGFLWTYVGASTPFIFGSVMAIIAALFFKILLKK